MGFNVNNMARVSTSANDDAQKVWVYNGTASGSNDAIAVVTGSGYFDDFQVTLVAADGPLQVGDVIFCNGNDTNLLVAVSAVTTAVTVAAY